MGTDLTVIEVGDNINTLLVVHVAQQATPT